jgi:hypothetical protein
MKVLSLKKTKKEPNDHAQHNASMAATIGRKDLVKVLSNLSYVTFHGGRY